MPTPPVFIVVANNIANAAALADHIAGWADKRPDGSTVYHEGACPLFANYRGDGPTGRVRTLLVHSQLEGEAGLSAAVKAQAGRLRRPGDDRDDRDIVRGEFMPVKRPDDDPAPPKPRYEVRSIAGRRHHRIEFPNVERYLTEPGADGFRLNPDRVIRWAPKGAREAELAGSVGETTTISAEESLRRERARIAVKIVTATGMEMTTVRHL